MRHLLLIILLLLLISGCAPQTPISKTQQGLENQSIDKPVYISDHYYQGVPVKIGVQGDEALPVQAILQTEQDLPVSLHMEQGRHLPVELKMKENERLVVQVEGVHSGKLPVEVATAGNEAIDVQISTSDEALAVKFGLPAIPQEAILPLALAGGGLLLLTLFSFLAAIASYKAVKNTEKISEMYLRQISEKNQNH